MHQNCPSMPWFFHPARASVPDDPYRPIEDTVRQALADGRVHVALQPIARANAPQSVAFSEALVRLKMEDGSWLMPGAFLPELGESDLVVDVDIAVLEGALAKLAVDPLARISVNVSPASIMHIKWIRALRNALRPNPDLAYRLIVEITENAYLLSRNIVADFIAALRMTGCTLALDDFGAGATAFRFLRDLRFDIVKIDGSFCKGVAQNPDNQVLIKALVGISRHFGMLTVAEFIETQDDLSAANALGVDCIQGYFIGRPEVMYPGHHMQVHA